jgi:hypothetical protein
MQERALFATVMYLDSLLSLVSVNLYLALS